MLQLPLDAACEVVDGSAAHEGRRADAELGSDAPAVCLHGLVREFQSVSDFLAGEAEPNEFEDLDFAGAQRGGLGVDSVAAAELANEAGDLRAQDREGPRLVHDRVDLGFQGGRAAEGIGLAGDNDRARGRVVFCKGPCHRHSIATGKGKV